MFKRIICISVIIPFIALTSGCASYRFGRLPSPYINDYPNPITQKGVSVAVKFMHASEADTTFDCEMTKRKISPVFIAIDNKSQLAYGFRKADIDASYLSAEEVSKKCARKTMARVATYGLLGLIVIAWVVFIPLAIAEMINSPRINSQMRNDYITNEIADTTIAPGYSVSGVIFVNPLSSGQKFNVPLTSKDTGEKLIFEFYKN